MASQRNEDQYRTDNLVVRKIIELTANGHIPAVIYRILIADPELNGFKFKKRTVERIARDHRPPSAKPGVEPEYWNLLEEDGDDARHILEARYGRMLRYQQGFPRPERWETELVAKILRAVPDLPRDIAWFVALWYGMAQRGSGDTTFFDDYLACAPWRSESHYANYLGMVNRRWVQSPFFWEVLVEQQNPSLSFDEKSQLMQRWNQQEWNPDYLHITPLPEIDSSKVI